LSKKINVYQQDDASNEDDYDENDLIELENFELENIQNIKEIVKKCSSFNF
jgi:hypothetical protein